MMRRMMAAVFSVMLAVLLVSPVSWAASETVSGKIQAVDATGRMILLEDGTRLVIPATVQVSREQIREGATVQVTYDVSNGQNLVRSIRVQPAR